MPEIDDEVAHVVDYLFEVGPVTGDGPVTFGEIESWTRLTGAALNEFEATAIRELSQNYLGMLREAVDPKCMPPVLRQATLKSKTEVSNMLGAILRSFNTPQAKAERAKKQVARAAKVDE